MEGVSLNLTVRLLICFQRTLRKRRSLNCSLKYWKSICQESVSPRRREIENTPPTSAKKRKPPQTKRLSLKERWALAAKKQKDGKLSFGNPSQFIEAEEAETIPNALIANPRNSNVERVVELTDLKRVYKMGCGLFGSVDCVQYNKTGDKYALKVISKGVVKNEGIIENLSQEKETLLALDSPFIIKLYSTLQSEQYCFFLLELARGGEFYELLLTYTTFSESWARFYASNVAVAFQHMHSRGVVYRDLKPENLMLDKSGYIKLIDLGFAKIINQDKTYTYCGTPDYLSPEMVDEVGHDYTSDWWGLGVLIFEMLIGRGPFRANSIEQTCKMITSGKVRIPPNRMTEYAENIIRSLCTLEPENRLGYKGDGVSELQSHPWFSVVDWIGIKERTVDPPYIPQESAPKESKTECSDPLNNYHHYTNPSEVPFEVYVDNDGMFERF